MLEALEQLEEQLTTEHCARGGDHQTIARLAAKERKKLGLDVVNSSVLCLHCLRKVRLAG